MAKTNWTPGPWKASGDTVIAASGIIGWTYIHPYKTTAAHANAHLFAAAPLLYEALAEACAQIESFDPGGCDVRQPNGGRLVKARAALAAARGEE